MQNLCIKKIMEVYVREVGIHDEEVTLMHDLLPKDDH